MYNIILVLSRGVAYQIVVIFKWRKHFTLAIFFKKNTTQLSCCYVIICANYIFLVNRGTRGVGVQSLHLRNTQLQDASGGPWRTPHQATPHTAGERRPGSESAAHHWTRGTHLGINNHLIYSRTWWCCYFTHGFLHAALQKKTAELNKLKEDLDVMKEKCELFLRQAAGSPSVPTLSSELTVLVQSMSQVYSMSSIYMDK